MAGSVGAGPMWRGTAHPSGRAEYPVPYGAGTPIGEFLRVESLLRVAPHRLFELLNNVGPKWKSRKCWACGNKFIPDMNQRFKKKWAHGLGSGVLHRYFSIGVARSPRRTMSNR